MRCMRRSLLLFLPLVFTACGLAEDEQDEKNKYIYLSISDPAFETYCLETFDTDRDGRLSRYEAQRVREIACPDRGIGSLFEIGEFTRLERLDCAGNNLTLLDLRRCTLLRRVVCSENSLASLDINGLRGLTELDCARNDLVRLDLQSNASLSRLVCGGNSLRTLDVGACARTMEEVDARDCPSLVTLAKEAGQQIRTLRYGPPTEVVER